MACGMSMKQQQTAAETSKAMAPCPMCGGSGMAEQVLSPEQELESLRAYVGNLEEELGSVKQRMERLSAR